MKNFGVKPYLFPMPTYMIGTYNEDDSVDVMMMAWGGICAEDMVALNLESEQQQIALLKKTIKKGLSVRQVEEAVKELNSAKPRKAEADEEFPESYSRLVEHLERLFTQEISIKKNNKGGGKIVIGFGSDDDIETFIGKLNGIEK